MVQSQREITKVPRILRKIKQRHRGLQTLAVCHWFCFTLENNQQPARHSPYNLPSVGVGALTHVTDISDLIWLVITPSYSFRAFHTSELQFQVLSRERDIQLCLWMITPLQRRSHFILCRCDYNNDNKNIRLHTRHIYLLFNAINTRFIFYTLLEALQGIGNKLWTCVTSGRLVVILS